ILIYVLTLLLSGPNIGMSGLMDLLAPSENVLLLFGMSGSQPVFQGHRWWTVLSAGWLHGNLLHIVFNILWIPQLAPAVGELYGPGRMVILYTLGCIVGFALTSAVAATVGYIPFLGGAQYTIGASAPIFGLLGALVYYGRRTGSSVVHGQAMSMALGVFMFGLFMPNVDNMAHLGGF